MLSTPIAISHKGQDFLLLLQESMPSCILCRRFQIQSILMFLIQLAELLINFRCRLINSRGKLQKPEAFACTEKVYVI